MYQVQEYVAGGWRTIERYIDKKPYHVPREFPTRLVAREYARRFTRARVMFVEGGRSLVVAN